jgi:hypothetical protein
MCDPGNADTALNGNTIALMCTCAFFREDHLVFGSGGKWKWDGSIFECLQRAANMVQKTNEQTLRASFVTRTLCFSLSPHDQVFHLMSV